MKTKRNEKQTERERRRTRVKEQVRPTKIVNVVQPFSLILLSLLVLTLLSIPVLSTPTGPSVQFLSNSTKSVGGGTLVNDTIADTGSGNVSSGAYIYTVLVTSTQQNARWKGYVGNVSGTLVLDDESDRSLFAWSLTASVSGEVYATRASGTINWSGVNCTWVPENATSAEGGNRTVEELENVALSHTNSDDNITATFALTNHSSMDIGGRVIGKNECFSIQTYQGSTASVDGTQTFADSDEANFTQIILYDGTTTTNGNIVYATFIEADIEGYRTDQTYDFQMILPENGLSSWTGSTGYYFYVELS